MSGSAKSLMPVASGFGPDDAPSIAGNALDRPLLISASCLLAKILLILYLFPLFEALTNVRLYPGPLILDAAIMILGYGAPVLAWMRDDRGKRGGSALLAITGTIVVLLALATPVVYMGDSGLARTVLVYSTGPATALFWCCAAWTVNARSASRQTAIAPIFMICVAWLTVARSLLGAIGHAFPLQTTFRDGKWGTLPEPAWKHSFYVALGVNDVLGVVIAAGIVISLLSRVRVKRPGLPT